MCFSHPCPSYTTVSTDFTCENIVEFYWYDFKVFIANVTDYLVYLHLLRETETVEYDSKLTEVIL